MRRRVAFVGSGAERVEGAGSPGPQEPAAPEELWEPLRVGATLEPGAGTFCWRSSRAATTTRDVQKAAWVPALGGGNAHTFAGFELGRQNQLQTGRALLAVIEPGGHRSAEGRVRVARLITSMRCGLRSTQARRIQTPKAPL